MDKFFRFNRRCNISFFFFFISFVKKKFDIASTGTLIFIRKFWYQIHRGWMLSLNFPEAAWTRDGRQKICAEFILDKSIIRMIRYITTRNRISRLTPTLFHRQRQKRTAVIFLFEKRVHPHRNWKVLRHIVDSRGGHMFSLRRVSSYLLVLFRGFHPIVIPKIPSQNILSISDREGKTYYRVSKGDKEKKKKRQKYTTKIKVINCCTLLSCNV